MKPSVWWDVRKWYYRLTYPIRMLTYPVRFVDNFFKEVIWTYAWYKYGNGSHIGGSWSHKKIFIYAFKAAGREEE